MIHQVEIDIVGYAASAFTTFSSIPQVYQIWKTKKANDVSMPYMITLFIGLCLWTTYGVLIENLPIIVANTISMFLSLTIIVMKIYLHTASKWEPTHNDDGLIIVHV